MRSGELSHTIATFLVKLWKIVDDPKINNLISWSSSGHSFYIRNQAQFAHELLPLYFKHNNMASFIRQLNMYGFHKVATADGGGLRPDKDEIEFSHPCFLKDNAHLLEHIKRKVSVAKIDETVLTAGQPELIKKVLSDVKGIKGRQESVSSQLTEMKRENEVLWREVAVLRQKHLKQQQIVNKLIQFLVSMVHTSPRSGIGIKRHYPFMLSNMPHSSSKASKQGEQLQAPHSPGGPVIHEIDPSDLLDECESQPENEQNTSINEEFLDQEFNADLPCPEVLSPAASASSMEELAAAVNTSSPEMLLELAEECHLSPRLYRAKKRARKASIAKTKIRKKKTMVELELKQESEEPCFPEEFITPNFIHTMPVVMNEDAQDGLQTPADTDEVVAITIPLSEQNSRVLEEITTEKIASNVNVDKVTKGTSLLKSSYQNNGNGQTEPGPSTESRTPRASDMAIVRSDASDLGRSGMTEDLDLHLDSMDSELDSLKELLKGEGYSLDANTLLGLFSEDPYSYELPMPMDAEGDDKVGSELMAYNNSTMDLAEMLGSSDDWLLKSPLPPTSDEARSENAANPSLTLEETDPFNIISAKKK